MRLTINCRPPIMRDADQVVGVPTPIMPERAPTRNRLFRDYVHWWVGAVVGSFLTAYVLEGDAGGRVVVAAAGVLIPGALTIVVRAVCWTIDRRLDAAQTLSTFVIAWAIFHGVIQVFIWYRLLTL